MIDYKIIQKYFPGLTPDQKSQFQQLEGLYKHWNEQNNKQIYRKLTGKSKYFCAFESTVGGLP